jgi:hypothetical protein
MALLGELFDKEITETLSEVYWLALEEITDREATVAFQAALKSCVFMPKPAELLDLAYPPAERKISQADAKYEIEGWLYSGGPFPSSQIAQHVIHSYGGRHRLEYTAFDDLKYLLNDIDERIEVAGEKKAMRLGAGSNVKKIKKLVESKVVKPLQ